MYRNFRGKEDLVKAVLRQRSDYLTEQLKTRLKDKPSLDEKIIAIFDWRGQWFCSTTFAGCLFGRAVAEFPDHSDIREIALDYKRKLHGLIQDEIAQYHLPETAATIQCRQADSLREVSTPVACHSVSPEKTPIRVDFSYRSPCGSNCTCCTANY